MKRNLFFLLFICNLAFICAGCKVGPNFEIPQMNLPARWHSGETAGTATLGNDAATSTAVEMSRWWMALNDEQLNLLLRQAALDNLGLRVARSRVLQARSQRTIDAAALWPTLNTSGSISRSLTGAGTTGSSSSFSSSSGSSGSSGSTTGTETGNTAGASSGSSGSTSASGSSGSSVSSSASGAETNRFQAGFDARWELDLFGGNRRAVEAAEAEIASREEALNNTLVSLLGETAQEYVRVRSLQRQIEVTRANLAAQEKTLEITNIRFEAGLASTLDVSRAKAQAMATAALLPTLQANLREAMHRIGVLLGREPGALINDLARTGPIPLAPADVFAGVPSDLLRRRPDIRQAERQAAAATARIGVAVADLFPLFTITGSYGRRGIALGDLTNSSARFWSIGPGVTWPIFDAGRIRANIELQNERQQEALINYEQTVLNSFEDVENGLTNFTREQQRRDALSEAVAANQHAVELAQELYLQGLTDFLNVLEAQRSLYSTQLQLTQSEAAVTLNFIALYKALGGGW